MKRTLLAILALVGLAGCGRTDGGGPSARAETEFRRHAISAYEAVEEESCRPGPSLPRTQVFVGEIAMLRTVEKRLESTGAGFQLRTAGADVALERANGSLGCSDDRDPAFARMHVEMARKTFSSSLEAMRALEPQIATRPPRETLPPSVGAGFRASVRPLIEAVHPLCALVPDGEEARIVGPGRAALTAFRLRLAGTPYATYFDMTAADVALEQTLVEVECAEPKPMAVDVRTRALTTYVQAGIAAIEARLPQG